MKIKKLNPYILSLLLIGCLFFHTPLAAQNLTNNGDTIFISSGTNMTVVGDFQNNDNGTHYPFIKNNGVLQLGSNLTKSPNMTYTGTDSLKIDGSSPNQNIPGLPYWYISVMGGSHAVMTGDATVKNRMIMSNGTLKTGTFTLSLDSDAILIEDSVNYIIGTVSTQKYLEKGINYTFIGIGLEIKADSMAPGLTTVSRVTGDHLTGHGEQSMNRYFEIVPSNTGNAGATAVFHYYDRELNSLSENDLGIYRKRPDATWQYDTFLTRNSATNIINFAMDTLGVITAGSIITPLPVELLSFDAVLDGAQTAKLNWATASEINNSHFDIERSMDGKIFTKVGEVKGGGNTNMDLYYQYMDVFGPLPTTVLYYRLRQVDYNGATKYSGIRVLRLANETEAFNAWYNGAGKTEAIVYFGTETPAILQLTDIQGKRILTQNTTFPKGFSHLQLDMSGLAKGIYMLSLTQGNQVQAKRVMVY